MSSRRVESWEQYHKRMLRETGLFIEWGLAHPDEVLGIPVKRTGEGGFPQQVGEWYWHVVLAHKLTDNLRRWRDMFRGRRWRS